MMKRFVALLLLVFVLVSCSAEKTEPAGTAETKETDATLETQDSTGSEMTETSDEEEEKVILWPDYKEAEPTLTSEENGVVNIGSERQLFVDGFLIDTDNSDAYINLDLIKFFIHINKGL